MLLKGSMGNVHMKNNQSNNDQAHILEYVIYDIGIIGRRTQG